MKILVSLVRQIQLRVMLCLAVVLTFAAPRFAMAAQSIDFDQLLVESQKQSAAADRLAMVWWMPKQFWQANFQQDDSMTDADREEILNVLSPYFVLLALDGTLGPFGGATFHDKGTLEESITLVDGNGERYSPLNKSQISPDAWNFVMMMRPFLTSMIGDVGENLHFFLFPAATSEGDRIADAAAPGSFSVELGEDVFDWILPLGSALPSKVCPEDGEKMSGAWIYCPWHGKKLVEQEEPIDATSRGGFEQQSMMRQASDLQQMLAQNPNDAGLMAVMGNIYFDASRWPDARDWYEKALQVSSGDPNILTDLAVVYRNLGEFERSIELLDRAIAVDSGHWQAWYNKVVVYQFDLHRHDAAAKALYRLKDLAATNPEVPDLSGLEADLASCPSTRPPLSTLIGRGQLGFLITRSKRRSSWHCASPIRSLRVVPSVPRL